MSKHTPGPWHVNDGTGCRWIETSKDDVIARIHKGACSRETFDANASLIAAAPELLEFAQEVRRTGDTRLASMAIAVIAKATGGHHD